MNTGRGFNGINCVGPGIPPPMRPDDDLTETYTATRLRLHQILTEARPIQVPRLGTLFLRYHADALLHWKCPSGTCQTRFKPIPRKPWPWEDRSTTLWETRVERERYGRGWLTTSQLAIDLLNHAGLVLLLYALDVLVIDHDHAVQWRWERR